MKKEKHRDYLLNAIGILFLSLGILAILNSLFLRNPTQIFWMCYISLIILGVGILTKDSFLIMSQVYILTIPVLIWNIDFLYWIVFNKSLWGITEYFFLERAITLGKIISLQHIFTVPLALYTTHCIGIKRNDAWKISIIQATLIFIAVSLFTQKEANINCVFDPCINVYFGLPYQLTWFLIFFSMIITTAIILNNIPYLRIKTKKG